QLFNNGEAFFIYSYFFLQYFPFPVFVMSISNRQNGRRTPSSFSFSSYASAYISTQILDELICHTKFYLHHQDIVRRLIIPPIALNMFDDVILQQPAYFPSIKGITCQPVEFPTENSISFSSFNH